MSGVVFVLVSSFVWSLFDDASHDVSTLTMSTKVCLDSGYKQSCSQMDSTTVEMTASSLSLLLAACCCCCCCCVS